MLCTATGSVSVQPGWSDWAVTKASDARAPGTKFQNVSKTQLQNQGEDPLENSLWTLLH